MRAPQSSQRFSGESAQELASLSQSRGRRRRTGRFFQRHGKTTEEEGAAAATREGKASTKPAMSPLSVPRDCCFLTPRGWPFPTLSLSRLLILASITRQILQKNTHRLWISRQQRGVRAENEWDSSEPEEPVHFRPQCSMSAKIGFPPPSKWKAS